MDVQLTPDLQTRLDALVMQTGRPEGDVVREALAGYLDGLKELRESLGSRYDEVRSGKVRLMDGEEAFARLRAESEAHRTRSA